MVLLGLIISWLMVALGALRVAMGYLVAFNFKSEEEMIAMSQRYLAETYPGDAIDEGMIYLVIGVVIGLLVKIAQKNTLKE